MLVNFISMYPWVEIGYIPIYLLQQFIICDKLKRIVFIFKTVLNGICVKLIKLLAYFYISRDQK